MNPISVAAVDEAGTTTSDVEVLGRHFGYNVDGTRKDDEWIQYPAAIDEENFDEIVVTEFKDGLNYQWSYPDGNGGYHQFDYIYHQHYKLPLKGDGSRDYSKAAFDAMPDEDRLVFDSMAWNQWARESTREAILDFGQQGTYFVFKFDYVNNQLSDYFLRTGAERGLFSHEFISKFGYFAFTNKYPTEGNDARLSDYYKNTPELQQYLVVDGVDNEAKFKDIVIYNRAGREQASGSANSGRYLDIRRKIFGVSQGYTSATPHTELNAISNIGTFIHEGALGHGFDEIPNSISVLLGEPNDQSWLTLGSDIPMDPFFYRSTGNIKPGTAVIGEGWATFGEFVGIIYNYYIIIDEDGKIDPNQVADAAIIAGLNGVSRLSSRQIIDAGVHDPRYAYTFNRMVREQFDISKIPITDSFFKSMLNRFVIGWAQQTTYAGGLIGNLGTNAYLKATVELNYKTEEYPDPYDFGAFVEFRINETDFIIGATLTELAVANLNKFVKPGIPLKPQEDLIFP